MSLTKQCNIHQPSMNFRAGVENQSTMIYYITSLPCNQPHLSLFPPIHLQALLPFLTLQCYFIAPPPWSPSAPSLQSDCLFYCVSALVCLFTTSLCLLVFSESSSLFSPTCSSPQSSITPSFHTSCSIFPPRMHLCFNALSFAFMPDLFSLRHTFLISFSTPPTCLPFHFL